MNINTVEGSKISIEDEATAAWISALCQRRRSTLLLAAALTCAEMEEHQTIISILELCIRIEPENAEARLLLAESYKALGQCEQAISVIERTPSLAKRLEAQSLLLYCYTSLTDEQYAAFKQSSVSSSSSSHLPV